MEVHDVDGGEEDDQHAASPSPPPLTFTLLQRRSPSLLLVAGLVVQPSMFKLHPTLCRAVCKLRVVEGSSSPC